MSTFYLSCKPISRTTRFTVTQRCTYISGIPLADSLKGEPCKHDRTDVEYAEVLLPKTAPERLYDLQTLANEIECAEKRKDARTAREIIASLPNELSIDDNIQIVRKFIRENILNYDLGAIAAIHEGKNEQDPMMDNPHVHIIVTTRPIVPDGFFCRKNRECDRVEYLIQCRESMARIQNEGYERNGLQLRVDHRSFRAQGIEREPKHRLRYNDYMREKAGERTRAGDYNREVEERNANRVQTRMPEQELSR